MNRRLLKRYSIDSHEVFHGWTNLNRSSMYRIPSSDLLWMKDLRGVAWMEDTQEVFCGWKTLKKSSLDRRPSMGPLWIEDAQKVFCV